MHSLLISGYTDVVDADLSAYFDTIPHAELMKSVARRVVDRRVLHLIKMWLNAPVEEHRRAGPQESATTTGTDEKRVSRKAPTLATARRTSTCGGSCLGWKRAGFEARLQRTHRQLCR